MRTFRDAGITGDFVHTRLQDPKNEIRLIHLKPSDANNDEIECTISAHPLSDAPPFAAISYTWGDMVSMRNIKVDGKRLSIGENSWLVLWQARLHKIPLPVWIDVLSINQTDSFEKGLQVSMMASIYAAAKFTCVGLGPQEDDSEFLAAEIREHAYFIEHAMEESGGPAACTACGRHPTSRMYRCKQCVDSTAYCVACKNLHVFDAGHDTFLDLRTDFHYRGICVQCEQPVSTRWYQPKDNPEGRLMKVCEKCAEIQRSWTSDDAWDREHVHLNEWEHMVKPQGSLGASQTGLKTFQRFYDRPLEDHLKIADAFRLLSMRPCFTRLWIIQEIMRSRPVVLVCGKDLFHSWEIEAIMNDIGGMPEPGEYPQRTRELGMRERPSFYFDMIVSHDLTFSKTIWSVMRTFVSHHCSDPRDRVFGLLALVDPEYREAFRPDYTKSATAVLLQVIEHHAEMDKGEDSSGNFFWARTIIAAFGLGPDEPDIASMRDRRRIAVHGQDPLSDITIATRDLRPFSVRENDPCSAGRLPQGLVDTGSRRIVLDAKWHCTVWKDGAGEFLVGFFHSALIVRRYSSTIATIVGQCILDSDVKSGQRGFGCVCRDGTHTSTNDTWQALMSPEDLLVFVAQDLKSVPQLPSKYGMPVADVSVHPKQSIERLTTRVTSREFSSYAKSIPRG